MAVRFGCLLCACLQPESNRTSAHRSAGWSRLEGASNGSHLLVPGKLAVLDPVHVVPSSKEARIHLQAGGPRGSGEGTQVRESSNADARSRMGARRQGWGWGRAGRPPWATKGQQACSWQLAGSLCTGAGRRSIRKNPHWHFLRFGLPNEGKH